MTPRRAVLAILVVLAVAGAAAGQTPAPAARTLILSTTTSTQDSGLLDVLIPMFEQATGYSVKTISVGTGQALALAAEISEISAFSRGVRCSSVKIALKMATWGGPASGSAAIARSHSKGGRSPIMPSNSVRAFSAVGSSTRAFCLQ